MIQNKSHDGKEDAEEAAAERLWCNVAVPWNGRMVCSSTKTAVSIALKAKGRSTRSVSLFNRPIVVRMVVEKKTAWM